MSENTTVVTAYNTSDNYDTSDKRATVLIVMRRKNESQWNS